MTINYNVNLALSLNRADKLHASWRRWVQLNALLHATKMFNPFTALDGFSQFEHIVNTRKQQIKVWLLCATRFTGCDSTYFRIRGLAWSTMFDKDADFSALNRHECCIQIIYAALSSAYLEVAAEKLMDELTQNQPITEVEKING